MMKIPCPISWLLALLASSPVFAQQANVLRIAVEQVTLHPRSPDLSATGPAFLTPQPAGITVDDATTLQLVYSRRFNEHWDIDLQLGVPPRLDVRGTGTLAPFGVIAHVREAGPSAFITYNFGSAQDRFRPLIGLGVNYSHFYDIKGTASGALAAGGPTRISLSDSFGPAAKVGVSYRLAEHWLLVGTIGVARIKTDVTATTGSIERKTSVDLRPVAYTLGIAREF
jgi:outer membrane protein